MWHYENRVTDCFVELAEGQLVNVLQIAALTRKMDKRSPRGSAYNPEKWYDVEWTEIILKSGAKVEVPHAYKEVWRKIHDAINSTQKST